MWKELLNYIICPACGNPDLSLKVEKNENDHIEEGSITCLRCDKLYPINFGVPILLKNLPVNHSRDELFTPTSEQLCEAMEPTKRVSSLVKKIKPNVALDAGCGKGTYTQFFNTDVLISFDISPFFVRCAEKTWRDRRRHFLVADILDTPFKEGTFGFAFASNIIEHLERHQIENVIKEFARVVKPGGLIQMDVPNSSSVIEYPRKTLAFLGVYKKKKYEESPELKHHSQLAAKDLRKFGFKVHGCIGWVTRKSIPIGFLWDLYDRIAWLFPQIAGTIIGSKNRSSTE